MNLLWRRLFGQGLVHPVDQMHSENPPSHPELLAWLARDLRAHGYDLRRTIRGLALSQAYGRSSRWEQGQPPAPELFAVALVRPLSPTQYGTTLRLASSPPDQFPASLSPEDFDKRLQAVEAAGRGLAAGLEQPRDDFQVSVDEALLFSNNERLMKEALRSDNSLLAAVAKMEDRSAAIDLAFWNIFGRPADAEEQQATREFLDRRQDRLPEAWRHVLWAMLTSSECRFNY